MAVGSALVAALGCASALAANYQGLWWAAPEGSESGWGINFAHQGDVIFATWFTYGATGEPLWLTLQANHNETGTYTGSVYVTRGPPFGAALFEPGSVAATKVGSAMLTFPDSDHATFTYELDLGAPSKSIVSGSKNLVRQQFGPLPTCTWGEEPNLARATNYQDLWWALPAGSESGWGINFTHQGDTIFATWFTYNTDGRPWWLSFTAKRTAPLTYTGDIYATSGPPLGTVPFDSTRVATTKVGTATLVFTNGNNASFGYSVGEVFEVKALTRQIFAAPGTVCTGNASMKPLQQVTLFTETANPLLLSFAPEGGSRTTFFGRKNSDGAATALDGMYFESGPTSRDLILFDNLGRPTRVTTADQATMKFSWQSSSDFNVEFVSADGKNEVALRFRLPPSKTAKVATTPILRKAGDSVNAVLQATVTEGGSLASDATVWAAIMNAGSVTGRPYVPLAPTSAGKYAVGFVNYPSDIPPGTVDAMCSTIVEYVSPTCETLIPISEYMTARGCVELSLALLPFVTVRGASLAWTACEQTFASALAACTAYGKVPTDDGSFCKAIDSTVALFDPDGVVITATAEKHGSRGTAVATVPGRQARVELNIELACPPPLIVFGGVCREGFPLTKKFEGRSRIAATNLSGCHFVSDGQVRLDLTQIGETFSGTLDYLHPGTDSECNLVRPSSWAGGVSVAGQIHRDNSVVFTSVRVRDGSTWSGEGFFRNETLSGNLSFPGYGTWSFVVQ
jgi:hypothetical protein